MLVQAALLIQDVQLLCFTIVFTALAVQRWEDRSRRWLWYGFLANTAGALIDLFSAHLPVWIGRGINGEMIPLSYAMLNIALVHFTGRGLRWKARGISMWLLAAGLPFFVAWQAASTRVPSDSIADLLIGLECLVSINLLAGRQERSTRAPRRLMAAFLAFFVGVELARVWAVFGLGVNPDASGSRLAMLSAVTYVVNTSLLPLAFIWMMHARLEWDLIRQSIIDPLTEVLNRRGLEQALEKELVRYRRYGGELTVAILDLDHFKSLNDQYGHAAGDKVLLNLAQFLSGRLRKADVVGRLGGEEFVLLMPQTEMEKAHKVLEAVCRSLSNEVELFPSAGFQITASFGVTSTGSRRKVGAAELLHEADMAMYAAKKGGRNRVCFFPTSERAVAEEDEQQAGIANKAVSGGGAWLRTSVP